LKILAQEILDGESIATDIDLNNISNEKEIKITGELL